MKLKISESCDSFRKLRESGAYYVDKTMMLKEFLTDGADTAVLFARPRRFGKSMTMTMFRDFLDIRQDSREIFSGLKIMDQEEVVRDYLNQYPVIFLSLKEVFGNSFDQIFRAFQSTVSTLCKEYSWLLQSDSPDAADKELLDQFRYRRCVTGNEYEVLDLLSRMLRAHFGKQVFVIIDEYDVPMAKAFGTPAYDAVRDLIEHMLSYVCKTNENVRAVLLSGCLYTVKNSTYTGVNNLVAYTVLSPRYASSIGFTDEEVRGLLEDAGLAERYEEVAEWYDGYLFGRERMYCPWDVLRYVSAVQEGSYSEAMGPESYWVNTSETPLDIIHGFLGKTSGANESLEQLLAGKTIISPVNDQLPYHQIYDSGENPWSALVETGYLTKTVTERMPRMPLRIPNRSIQIAFRQEVWSFFRQHLDNAFVSDLENALWAGEPQRAEAALNLILEASFSFYHEYHEYSYHLMLLGFFTGLGYRVLSEIETGYGRSDLIIPDRASSRCMILELKHAKEEKEMSSPLDEAVNQIIRKKYDSRMKYEGYTMILRYGVAFYQKKALIRNG